MLIPCPHCGARLSEEFVCHGDATRQRPAYDASDEAWTDYVYLRDNPAGAHREHWYHAAGCHAWLVVTRDTRTHQIIGVEVAR
ncbi:sarcosine oxidase subunit delta [Parapedomonas caeni]